MHRQTAGKKLVVFFNLWSNVAVKYDCLFVCQKEDVLGHFRRVDFEAGERGGVADAPLPDSHRTATPTVTRVLAILQREFLGVRYWH